MKAAADYDCANREQDASPVQRVVRAPDLRTKEGRRAEIIAQVEESGGFSVFWVTEHKLRAIVGTEMLQRGELVETRKSSFPWHALKVAGRSNDPSSQTPNNENSQA